MKTHRHFAEQVALQAGGIIRQNFDLNMKKEWKEDNTPLTVTDTIINQLVLDAVADRYPDHAVLAEEGNLDREHAEYVWVCDPVDGTIPFSHGIPTSVFSLALVHNGTPIVGVVYDPFTDRLFSAEKGMGGYLNGSLIHVSDQADVVKGLIGIGYAWNHVNLRDVMHELIQRKAIAVQFASNVYMGSLVAAGEFLAVFFPVRFRGTLLRSRLLLRKRGDA